VQIRYLKEAVADARREALFWQKQRSGLEEEFAKEFEAAIQAISLAPSGYVRVSKKRALRRFHEKRFHTQIIYEYLPEENLLQIVRVYNSRMNPYRFVSEQ